MMHYLETNKGEKILVDKDISLRYKSLKLRLRKGYPSYDIYSPETRTKKTMKLHRTIIGAKEGEEVDHINRDKMDNRRENLRICTRSENLINRSGWGKSKLKGVSWKSSVNRWYAHTYIDGKATYIGSYRTEEEAGRSLGLL